MSVRRTAAAVLAAGLLLAGCSEGPEPRFEPTGSPSPTESSSSAAPESQSPEEFIREWVALYNEFEKTGEDQELVALTKNCPTCLNIIKVVSEAYAKGGYVKSQGWEVQSSRQIYRRGRSAGVRADVQVSPSAFKASASSAVTRGTGGEVTMEFDLVRETGAWKLQTVTRIAS